jgi:hypothetical protein
MFLAPAALRAENYIRIESQGRSFVVDADSSDVQKNLKPADPQAGEVKLPAWLYPFPGAAPIRANYDVRTGIASATFGSGGTPDQIAAYYDQLFRSKGLHSDGPMGSGASRIVSGKSTAGAVSVSISVFRGNLELTVTYAPLETKSAKKHFEAAWYDDTRGLLCLRDTATGEQYYLDRAGIAEANLNRPGGVASESASLPAWLPVYPNARRATVHVIWLFEPTATFQTRDSIHAVYDFYLAAVKNAGARVLSSGILKSGTPSTDFSAQIVAQLGDDVVDIRTGEIVGLNAWPPSSGATGGTGIGIRYTVPKR